MLALAHMRPLPAVVLLACVAVGACGKPKVTVAPQAPATPPPDHLLIPAPAKFVASGGAPFAVTPRTRIVVNHADAVKTGAFLARLIAPSPAAAVSVEVDADVPADGAFVLTLDPGSATGEEGYRLSSTAAGVRVTAARPAGLFYGVQTIRQLMPVLAEHEWLRRKALTVPAVEITDAPRFGWRGAMLDVSRHFFGVDEVTRLIDLMALHKLNRLHLHLADDQGWRIEIDSWPNLTRHGGSTEVGGGPGGFYTKAQYADIVKYAADRFITIVPEIDMPGHTNAALASYAELNCDGQARPLYTGTEVGFSALCVEKEITYKFIDDVVREISAITPGPWFHIGGDEVKTLSAEQYNGFINRVQGIVQSHGKQMVGWDEIAPANLLPTSVVQHWRPKTTPKEAVAKGAKVIMSVANRAYIDMKYDASTPIGLTWAAIIEVKDSYDWDPAATAEGVPESALLGVEAPLWSETL